MAIIVSHPMGNANVRAVLAGLKNTNLLTRFYTSIAAFEGSLLYNASTLSPLSEIRRRTYAIDIKNETIQMPWYEAGRLISGKLGLKKLVKHETGIFSVDNVYRKLDNYVASHLTQTKKLGIKGIYAYEDGALESFKRAKALSLACLYDLPIGYWRSMHKLLEVEKHVRPEWAATLTGFNDSPEKLARKDQELALADHIFVASSFTAKTLAEYPGKLSPVSVIPYGFPTPVADRTYVALKNRPLKVLFVGGLSQRKGIANLVEAVKEFGANVELTIVGQKAVEDCKALNEALSKHRWIPSLPHNEILAQMQQHDVFVFPSLFEGFGLVITEAMSQGTPVITTDRTAGPDVITNGENGWLVEAGSTGALKAALENILTNPGKLESTGRAAIDTARNRPWKAYSSELSAKIKTLL